MGNNLFFSSLADAFMKVTPITLGGAFVLLIGNFPIPAWTNFLQKIGWATQFNAAQNATMNVLSLFVVFNFAYVYAEKCKYNPLPAGLLAASSFMILAPQDYMARAFGTHAKLTQVTAFGTNYLGSSGMVIAILVGWVVGMLYVFLNKKNIVIKLPDSVPPNVADSLQPSLIAGIILVLMTLFRGAFSYTAFGNIFDCVTKLVQAPLQTFTASPIIIADGIVNQNAFKAGQPMPYVTMSMLSMILNSAFGGQGATIGLIISMFKAKSDRYKQMLKLAGVPALFNINEPLVFGMPIILNPVFFLPMIFEPIIKGLVSWGLIDLFHATVNPFIQLPWTMPGVVQAFFSGGIPFFIIAMVVVVLSTLIWFPFFKIADNKAVAEEQKSAKKA
jgi:PTS system cellobiose-specific IIC component